MTNGARDARAASAPLMCRQRPTPTLSSMCYLGVAASPARGAAVSTATYDADTSPGPALCFEYRALVYSRHPDGEKVVLLTSWYLCDEGDAAPRSTMLPLPRKVRTIEKWDDRFD